MAMTKWIYMYVYDMVGLEYVPVFEGLRPFRQRPQIEVFEFRLRPKVLSEPALLITSS